VIVSIAAQNEMTVEAVAAVPMAEPSPRAFDLSRSTPPHDMKRAARAILVIVLLLMGLGQVMVYSAKANQQSATLWNADAHALKMQAAKVLLALGAMVALMRLDYRKLEKLAMPCLIASLGLLLLVLVPGPGARLNAARRWINLSFATVQPSDFARLALIMYLAAFFHRSTSRLHEFYRGFGPPLIATGVVSALVLAEPDFGTTITICAVAVVLMLAAGTRITHLLAIVFVTAPIMLLYVSQSLDYVVRRFDSFLNPQRVSQVYHSVQSIASGGAFGVGLGAGSFKLHFVPETENDFVFSVIGEELGFFGCTLVILLYCGLIVSGVRLLLGVRDRFGFLLGTGILFSLSLPAVINIAVATASAPAKGLPLPFVSAGGTSLLASAAGVGILISLARSREPARAAAPII
jgi:cell division protein FtsW